jgi:hypothetical protein
MPGRSLNHAKRSSGTIQGSCIAVLDNENSIGTGSTTVAPNHQPSPQSCGRGPEYRNRRGAIQLATRHVTG